MDAKTAKAWMDTREATSATCLTKRTLDRLAKEGRIGVLKIPGVGKTAYSRLDIEALVASGTRPASQAREMAMA